MIYVRILTTSGNRLYEKIEASDFAEAKRRLRRKVRDFDRAEKITRQDFEVGLLEMDIQKASVLNTEPVGLGTPSSSPAPSQGKITWSNVIAGLVSFVCGIALMIFWSVWNLDARRSIIILVLSGVLLVMGLIFFVAGLIGRRNA